MSRFDLPRLPQQHLRFALRHRQSFLEQSPVVVDLAFQEPQQILIGTDLSDIDKWNRDRRASRPFKAIDVGSDPGCVVADCCNYTWMSCGST
jgi:hypothetical protein